MRERLCKILHWLAHESTLEIVRIIGTMVPTQSMQKARDLFEARRILEFGICMRLSERITDKELFVMREHLALERRAAETGPRPDFIYASSQIHLLLARFLNNSLVMV